MCLKKSKIPLQCPNIYCYSAVNEKSGLERGDSTIWPGEMMENRPISIQIWKLSDGTPTKIHYWWPSGVSTMESEGQFTGVCFSVPKTELFQKATVSFSARPHAVFLFDPF